MKTIYKPILFSTPMVQAIEKNQKRQTRRIIKPQPYYIENGWQWDGNRQKARKATGSITVFGKDVKPETDEFFPASAKYKIGDILWVRETWNRVYDADTGYFIRYGYRASDKFENEVWNPSIFMPKAAARYFLKVTNVRCEKLYDITEADAICEGVQYIGELNDSPIFRNYLFPENQFTEKTGFGFPHHSFITLWASINGQESTKSNPWVFAYDFEKIEKPQNWPL